MIKMEFIQPDGKVFRLQGDKLDELKYHEWFWNFLGVEMPSEYKEEARILGILVEPKQPEPQPQPQSQQPQRPRQPQQQQPHMQPQQPQPPQPWYPPQQPQQPPMQPGYPFAEGQQPPYPRDPRQQFM